MSQKIKLEDDQVVFMLHEFNQGQTKELLCDKYHISPDDFDNIREAHKHMDEETIKNFAETFHKFNLSSGKTVSFWNLWLKFMSILTVGVVGTFYGMRHLTTPNTWLLVGGVLVFGTSMIAAFVAVHKKKGPKFANGLFSLIGVAIIAALILWWNHYLNTN